MDINSFTEHQHPRGGPGHRQQRGPRPGHRNVRTSLSPAAGVTAASGVNHSPRPLLSRPHPFPRAANWKRAGLLRPRPATGEPGEKPRDSALWRRPLNFLVHHGEAPICFDSSVETRKVGSGERKRRHGGASVGTVGPGGCRGRPGCLGEGGCAPSSAGPSPPHPAGSACSAHLAGVCGPGTPQYLQGPLCLSSIWVRRWLQRGPGSHSWGVAETVRVRPLCGVVS